MTGPECGRRPRALLATIGVVVVAAAAGGVWYAAGTPADVSGYSGNPRGRVLSLSVPGDVPSDCEAQLRKPVVYESAERIDVSLRRDRQLALSGLVRNFVDNGCLDGIRTDDITLSSPLGTRPVYVNGRELPQPDDRSDGRP